MDTAAARRINGATTTNTHACSYNTKALCYLIIFPIAAETYVANLKDFCDAGDYDCGYGYALALPSFARGTCAPTVL